MDTEILSMKLDVPRDLGIDYDDTHKSRYGEKSHPFEKIVWVFL